MGRSVRADLVAGATVWAVLVPESLAYATIAGVPPVVGLYAAIPSLLLYALLGSSRHLVVAPMSATAALSLGMVGAVAGADARAGEIVALTAGLALATGVVAIVAGLLRLGFLAAFISEPVLKGFVVGLALTIVMGQLPHLLGLDKGPGGFFAQAGQLLQDLDQAPALPAVVGLSSLLGLLALRRWLPVLPASLVTALAGIGAVAAFGLQGRGVEVVGTIPAGLPDVGFPAVSVEQLVDLLAAAVGLMLIGFVEGLGAARAYAARAGHEVDPDRELLGLGAANLGAGLVNGMVVNGSLSKTAVNVAAGARTQLSGVTAAVLTVLTLLFLTGLFEQLPEATLAAIVVAAVLELVDVAALRRLWWVGSGPLVRGHRLIGRADFVAALGALVGVLALGALAGLVIGVGLSVVLLLARTSRPHVAVEPRGEGVVVVRVEAPLVFANAEFVRRQVRELAAEVPGLRLVVVDGRSTPSIDVTAAAMLVQLRADLAEVGAELVLAREPDHVQELLARAQPTQEPPVFPSVEQAVAGSGPAGAPAGDGPGEQERAEDRPDEP